MEEFRELTSLDHCEADRHANRWRREVAGRHARTLTGKSRRATGANLGDVLQGTLDGANQAIQAIAGGGARINQAKGLKRSRESERFIMRRLLGRIGRMSSIVSRTPTGSTADLGPAEPLPASAEPPAKRVSGSAPPDGGRPERSRGRVEGLAAGTGLGVLLGCGVLLLALQASSACFDGR